MAEAVVTSIALDVASCTDVDQTMFDECVNDVQQQQQEEHNNARPNLAFATVDDDAYLMIIPEGGDLAVGNIKIFPNVL